MHHSKWPKILPALTKEQESISHDFMQRWLETIALKPHYGLIDKYFNHGYVIRNAPKKFLTTLDIGAGIGEHLKCENLTKVQKANYVALDIRKNLTEKIQKKFPEVQICVADCQEKLPFSDNYFDRTLAIHVLEHLPNLPAAIKEIHRLCNKTHGVFSVVIPCEGGIFYKSIRKITAQRIFERRYQQSYTWFIEREHINKPQEIFTELSNYFEIKHRKFFPFIIPSLNANLFVGLTLIPKINVKDNY